MVDEEVENILLEIRERVRAQEPPSSAIANLALGNGDSESSIPSDKTSETSTTEALARIDSYLTTTSRAWGRLPPLVSNRSGGIARLELWLKRQIKRMTHWFTWEQVNFNAAVHQALRDTLQALSDSDQALAKLRAEMAEMKVQQREAQRAQEHQRTMIEQNHARLKVLRAESEAQRNEIKARLSELSEELRERNALLQEEQRVCFKQLSLEATESAVLEDRARRKNETLLEELSRRVELLENSET